MLGLGWGSVLSRKARLVVLGLEAVGTTAIIFRLVSHPKVLGLESSGWEVYYQGLMSLNISLACKVARLERAHCTPI